MHFATYRTFQHFCHKVATGISACYPKSNTRCNKYKLLNHTFHYDLRKCSFCARIVNIWNSLPNTVVDVDTVCLFKARLDKFWMHQVVKYDFTANLTGIGDRSVHDISIL